MRLLVLAMLAFASSPLKAEEIDINAIVQTHVLPAYERLADETAGLAHAAKADCGPNNQSLINAYHDAFDAWIGVSHLRFGPSEQDNRAFALAYWPDPRGSTPKALTALITIEDPVAHDPQDFADVSIAARGFYALEFLLFDPSFANDEKPDYHCALVQAIASDIALNAAAILHGWEDGYADLITDQGNDTYRSEREAAQQFFTALTTGLEFTSQTRIARPLGTFDQPRPNRAEARRSGRSLKHVLLSLRSTRDLAQHISLGDPVVAAAFTAAIQRAENLNDPTFSGATDPQGRLRIEVLQQHVEDIRRLLSENVGPSLGIASGFNALDGD